MVPPISANYTKLKTNLRLSIQRLKLLNKKKTELTSKSRNEIGQYLGNDKIDRAKIRVEHIIREDYLTEAYEMLEMYCDLLIARFGMIEQMKTVDEGLVEAISSIIWAAPRIEGCPELKVVADLLSKKYGKQFAVAARENSLGRVNKKLCHRLGVEVPPKVLVEKYLVEIAKSLDLAYRPDPNILNEKSLNMVERFLLDLESDDPSPSLIPAPSQDDGNGSNSSITLEEVGSANLNVHLDDIESVLPQVPSSIPAIPNPVDEPKAVQLKADLEFEELTKRFEALKRSK